MRRSPRHSARPAAIGNDIQGVSKQVSVVFDSEMFAQIRARAEKEGTSFGEQVRCLCEWALMDTKADAP